MLKNRAGTALAVCLLAVFGVGQAQAAAIIGFVVEGGGTQQVYQLNNGNFLGLWGFDNREGANPGAGAVTINTAADITGGFTPGSGATIVNYYNGTNPINLGASEFDPLAFDFTVADNARLFDSVWVEWTGGNLVYNKVTGGTATMGASVTPGFEGIDPIIPEPGTAALAVGLIGGLAMLRRRRA